VLEPVRDGIACLGLLCGKIMRHVVTPVLSVRAGRRLRGRRRVRYG
jgi:hypothetical protein